MLTIVLAALLFGEAPSCTTADPRVEDVIASKARELGGHEHCQFRLYEALSDVDGDGQDDFLVVFAVEGLGRGGNDSVQFLAAFPSASEWKPTVLKVGARGERVVETIDVSGSDVVLETSEYRAGDPQCCPGGKGELRLRVVRGRLLPVATSGPPHKKAK